MAITKLKRGETYFYVDGWTKGAEPGAMVANRVIEIEALTGGAKQPRVVAINGDSRHYGKYAFTIFFGGNYANNSVWATREEAEAATFIDSTLQKFYGEPAA